MHGALTGVFCAARLMLFVGGPSTCGGGMIVNTELSEAIRSHKVSIVKSIFCHNPLCYEKLEALVQRKSKNLVSAPLRRLTWL